MQGCPRPPPLHGVYWATFSASGQNFSGGKLFGPIPFDSVAFPLRLGLRDRIRAVLLILRGMPSHLGHQHLGKGRRRPRIIFSHMVCAPQPSLTAQGPAPPWGIFYLGHRPKIVALAFYLSLISGKAGSGGRLARQHKDWPWRIFFYTSVTRGQGGPLRPDPVNALLLTLSRAHKIIFFFRFL